MPIPVLRFAMDIKCPNHKILFFINRLFTDTPTYFTFVPRWQRKPDTCIPPTPPPALHGATASNGSGWTLYRGYTITLGRNPLDEWSARCRDLSTWQHTAFTRDIHAPAGFEPAIPASKRPQTHALDGAAAGIDPQMSRPQKCIKINTITFTEMRVHCTSRMSVSLQTSGCNSKRFTEFVSTPCDFSCKLLLSSSVAASFTHTIIL
jgi:hypothetical protein